MALIACPAAKARIRAQDDPTTTLCKQTAGKAKKAREGHLRVPGKHDEEVNGVPQKLGTFLDTACRRTNASSEARRAELTEFGMRWWTAEATAPAPVTRSFPPAP